MLKDIFKDNFMHEFYVDMIGKEQRQLGQEEERQVRLQHQRKILLTIVQTRFPTLMSLAQTQADQINSIDLLEEVTGKVGAAKTQKAARQALLNWQ